MVVAAGDSYLADPGFADDASEAMPGFEYDDAMPTDGDIAALPDAVFEDGAATPEAEPFTVESLPLTPEQLTAFRDYVSAELTPQLEDQFTQERTLWEQQKQSLEAKVNAFDRDRRQAATVLAARQQVYAKFFEENGMDPRDLESLEYRVSQQASRINQHQRQQQAQAQQVQQAQSAEVAEFQTWQSEISTQMKSHVSSLGLNAEDPRINQRFQRVIQAAQAWSTTQTPQALQLYNDLKAEHKEWVGELATSAQKRKAAKPANDALARQRARGPQNLSRGGAGAGPVNPTDVTNKAWELYPHDELQRSQYVRQQLQPTR